MSDSLQLTDADVVQYLQDNPDFFIAKDELLASLRIPHDSGQATSLIERQLAVYRERNVELRQRLTDLLENARRNDKLFGKTKRLVLALINAQNWIDIEAALDDSLRQDFNVDHWTLLYFSEQKLEHPMHSISNKDKQREIHRLFKGHRAFCGQLTDETMDLLLDEKQSSAESIAAAQIRNGQQTGVLSVASDDPKFYRSSMDTLFLDYIADVLGLILPTIPQS
ncbi:hypothetical protein A9R00_03145 [Oleispira antarctica]|uniref:DUF484 domain-containing protein n=1 Tax=Oleispira antarctica TaxID=188908 RepID=A0A1Y5HYL8_OLEAN|nr:hypothetical protein A9R00_03145 [Oleispira antarctica]